MLTITSITHNTKTNTITLTTQTNKRPRALKKDEHGYYVKNGMFADRFTSEEDIERIESFIK